MNKNLTILEKLFFNKIINKDIFIDYYHLNFNNKLYEILIKNKVIANNLDIDEINIKLNENIVDMLNEKDKKYLYINGFYKFLVIENILYLLITDDINLEENIYQFKYKEIKLIKINKNYLKNIIQTDNINVKNNNDIEMCNIPELANKILFKAIEDNATDIHIDPKKENFIIKFRINGELINYYNLKNNIKSELIVRLKIMANLDIAINNNIQDGELSLVHNNKKYNLRISTIPTIYGEKIALRILENEEDILQLGNLEFKENLSILNKLVNSPNGLVLVVGPTGCGKSTTLYSILKNIDAENKNIMTVENPVEIKINNVNQIQTNEKSNLTFSKVLKSMLRHDPNVIMVGEIRDSETAVEASRAAITGHLVLSTLHTNSSINAIERLIDIGVEPYMVSASLIGVISQRLVKELCPNCKEKYIAKTFEKKLLNNFDIKYLFRKGKCEECKNGYIGRKALFEIMYVDDEIREYIRDKDKNKLSKDKYISLRERYIDEIINGNIEIEEIYNLGEI